MYQQSAQQEHGVQNIFSTFSGGKFESLLVARISARRLTKDFQHTDQAPAL